MQLKTYYPYPKFPVLSLSGGHCELHCEHCDASYLSGMLAAPTPETLWKRCVALKHKGAVGMLLSGGSAADGTLLNLRAMLPTLHRIRRELGLILNVHPGLMDAETASQLDVDFASLEIPSNHTVQSIFGLNASIEDYLQTYHNLKHAGIFTVPHVSIYDGTEHQLLEGIEEPEVIVVIVFTPTKGTAMAGENAPSAQTVANVLTEIRHMFPQAELTLGCMRPRNKELRFAMEVAALEAGVSRMEIPSRKTLAWAQNAGYEIQAFNACCALPPALESTSTRRN